MSGNVRESLGDEKLNRSLHLISKDNYRFEIYWPSCEPYDPENEAVDIIVYSGKGEYSGTVVTLKFINSIFEKNEKTGECAEGSYFCIKKMVIVKRIDRETIKKTLDGLIYEEVFEHFFD